LASRGKKKKEDGLRPLERLKPRLWKKPASAPYKNTVSHPQNTAPNPIKQAYCVQNKAKIHQVLTPEITQIPSRRRLWPRGGIRRQWHRARGGDRGRCGGIRGEPRRGRW